MRRYLIIAISVAAVAALAAACSNKQTARVNGTFAGLDQARIYLEMVTTKERTIVDSAITNDNGDFRFTVGLPAAAPTFYNIVYQTSIVPLILAPGDKVTVSSVGDPAKNYFVEGSDDSQLLKEFNMIYTGGIVRLDSLSNLYSKIGGTTPAEQQALQDVIRRYATEYNNSKREHIRFIALHPSSMAAIYALYQRMPGDVSLMDPEKDIQYYRLVADSLGQKYPDSPHVVALQKDIEAIQKGLDMGDELIRKSENAPAFPEIELPDMLGKMYRLSDLSGKVILVDFWSVHDENNVLMNAELRKLYDAYKDKGFEIYQVALGNDKPVWVTMVQNQKLPWTSVIDTRGAAGVPAMSYAITSVPANVLIDKEGNIAGKDIFGDELIRKVEQLTK